MTRPAGEGIPQLTGPVEELLGEPFRLESITEVPAPDDRPGTWHHYVILQGTNKIVGVRSGLRPEVTLALESLVEHLNERFERRPAKLERALVRRPRRHVERVGSESPQATSGA